MNFTAIDFETANSSRASACAVGICTVQDGAIIRCDQWFIRPAPLYFSPFNVSIHGITDADVTDAPAFAELWPELLASISGPLVAHNASFDIGVIRKSLDAEGLSYPDIDFFCSCVLSKMAWPSQPTYGLDHMAGLLGLSLEHHNAKDDSRVCALLAIEACKVLSISSFYDLEEPFGFSRGRLYPGGFSYCRGISSGSAARKESPSLHKQRLGKVKAANIVASVQEYDTEHPFYGKTFVFTGAMTALLRRDAMQAVVDRGGKCHDTITQDVNVLVLGQGGYLGYRDGEKSNKMRKAESLLSNGFQIEIMSESDFVSML